MNPGRIAYMSTTPEVNGPMVLAWHADLATVIPALKGLGYAGIELQTRNPADAVMQAMTSGDRDSFYAQEAEFRSRAGAPPYGRLAAVILAWIFVVSRYAHAYVHVTSNNLRCRSPLFLLGFLAVFAMWVWLGIWMAFS